MRPQKAVMMWLVIAAATIDPEATIAAEPPRPRLLETAAISLPSQEIRTETEDWAVVARFVATSSTPDAGEGIGDEVDFATSTFNESLSQLQQSVATLADGGYAVVWVEGDFPERDVRMQWLSAAGETLFEDGGRIVAGMAGFEESDAVVAPHPEAGAFVAFARGAAPGNFASVYVQSYDAGGNPRWDADGIQAGLGGGQSDPWLVPDATGGVFVCWTEDSAPWCQHLSPSGGQLWGSNGIAAGGVPGLRVLPRAVADGSGGLLVFWRNQRDPQNGTPEPMLMEGQRFAADGTKIWGDAGLLVRTTNLAESNGFSMRFFNVVADGDGGAILAFNDLIDAANNLDVAIQRVGADGSLLWSDPTVVVAAPEHHQHDATVAAPDGGAFVVALESIDSTRSRLWLYRLGSDGTHRWPAAGTALSGDSALNYGAFGRFDHGLLRLVWTHQLFPATFEMDVHHARYTLDGERLDEDPEGVAVTTVGDAQFARGIAYSRAAGKALAVWDDRRKGTWDDLDVYGAQFQLDGIFFDGFESGDTSAWSAALP